MTSGLQVAHRLYDGAFLESIGQSREMSRARAAELGRQALCAAKDGLYRNDSNDVVDWSDLVAAAKESKRCISPEAALPTPRTTTFETTIVEITNETTLGAARRLTDTGLAPLALNFANGVHPGGGWLGGARAQEEVLCRSSALQETLYGDPMYGAHRAGTSKDFTDWVILSPHVPVFRRDDGAPLGTPWLLSFITSAAPVAHAVGQPLAGDLLAQRIRRVLAVAHAYGYTSLVLGAWGCGAFSNDPHRTALDFRTALETQFRGCFSHVVFGIPTQFEHDTNFSVFAQVLVAAESSA